jgi:threonine dehydrogenase-like Zn-dependent dehydrogenase
VKAYVCAGDGRAELRDLEVPVPGHGEALVKVTTASICATDLKIIDGRLPVEPGRVIGHELVGEFVEGGPGVHGFAPGDRVFVHADTPCGECPECLGNQNGQGCQTGGSINAFHFGVLRNGGHAEYAVVPFAPANLVRIPDSVTDEQAVMLCCVGSTGVAGVERSGIRFGDTVAIMGQGPVGLSATVAAGLCGAARIIAIDGMPDRLERARRMGADDIVHAGETDVVEEVRRLTGGRMADVAIEAVGVAGTFLTALRLTRPAGTLSSIGNYGISDASLSLPLGIDEFMGGIGDKRIVTTAAPGGKDRGRRLLSMAASGRLVLDSYITHTFALDEIDTAIDLFRDKRDGVFKVAIKP